MQLFGYREREKKAGKMPVKAYLLRILLLSQRSKEPMIFSKNSDWWNYNAHYKW